MRNRSQLALGIILILLGGWFIAQQQIPGLNQMLQVYMAWPLNIVSAGALILLIGLLVGAPGMAVPAAIVAGIGGILYYQQITKDYTSWSFMWALIPAFVGVGEIINGTLSRNGHKTRNGFKQVGTGAVLFVIFAAIFGRLNTFGSYAPAAVLILLGAWVLGRSFWRKSDGV
jgi:hypothetical protein